MGIEVGGIFGLIIIIADVWAMVRTIQSPASGGAKIIWCIFIIFLPILGLIVWLFAGPRPTRL